MKDRFHQLLPCPHNPITSPLDHHSLQRLHSPCSPEISPYADNFLFGPSFCVKIADLPCSPIIHLRSIEESNKDIDSRNATNHSRPCDKLGLSEMRKGKSQEKGDIGCILNQPANFQETRRNIAERAAVLTSLAQITKVSTK